MRRLLLRLVLPLGALLLTFSLVGPGRAAPGRARPVAPRDAPVQEMVPWDEAGEGSLRPGLTDLMIGLGFAGLSLGIMVGVRRAAGQSSTSSTRGRG